MEQLYLVIANFPDQASAAQAARVLVSAGVCACVNLIPGITSIYSWNGQLEQAQECSMLIKTTATAYPALEKLILEQHPYQLPEIITLEINRGFPPT